MIRSKVANRSHTAYANIYTMMQRLWQRLIRERPIDNWYAARAIWFRWMRLLFPSAAELRFIHIMGGRYITVPFVRRPSTRRPLAIVFSLGRALHDERFGREIQAGRFWIDFGNDIYWGIEVDGERYHRDIVREQDREEYLTGFCTKRCQKVCYKHSNDGWRVKHINAIRLWAEPANVQAEVLKFLAV